MQQNSHFAMHKFYHRIVACFTLMALSFNPAASAAADAPQSQPLVSIYSIGDSTMADKPTEEGNPERGWCQALKSQVMDGVHFENHAVNGRSTKSFIDEGRWQVVLDKLQSGDWLLIQFGHNDQKIKSPERYTNPYTGYRYNLMKFVEESRAKGAFPILMSSIVRRNFNESGTLEDTHGAYPLVARLLAQELNIPFVDMQWLTEKKILELGQEASKSIHLVYAPGEHPFFPDGKTDNTHLSPYGADTYARLFIEEIQRQQLPLAHLFR